MRGITHAVFGLAIGLCFLRIAQRLPIFETWVNSYSLLLQIVGVLLCLFGSLVVDIDYHKSFLGKYFKILNYGVKHRGFLHSLFGVGFVFLLLYVCNLPLLLNVLLALGMLSHLALDALTKQGIWPFYPLTFRWRGFCKTGGFVDTIILFSSIVFVVFLVLLA